MMATSHNPLPLLFLLTLLISVAVPCHGDPVLDTDGDPVVVFSENAKWQYRIQNSVSGGKLARLRKITTTCESYVREAAAAEPGVGVGISATSSLLQDPYMQVGSRYGFTFRIGATKICYTKWRIGDAETTSGISFQPIIAGDLYYSDRKSWFEVRSTETEGVYKLAACPCEACKIMCPEVGSFVINGATVLGVGGNNYTVQFVKAGKSAMEMEVAEQ